MHKVKRRFRFYPTPAQKTALAQVFGCARFVYNAGLEWRKREFAEGRKPSYVKSSAWLTEFKREHLFLQDVSCVPLQQSLRHLDGAYSRFFKKQARFPTFKARDNRQSCEFTERAFTYKNGQLSLSKIGKLDVVWTLPLQAKPTTVTVVKEPSGKYFVTLTLLEESKTLPPSDKSVGVDLGIETFATFSDGRKFKAPAKIRKLRKKLAALQRKHSRAISESGWRQFRDMLAYKCEWGGRKLEIVSRWLPSSKTCSHCGEKVALTLKQRSWKCPACGTTHDRDVNAAKNILAAGQAAIARGGSVRPARTYVLKARPVKREPACLTAGIPVL